MSVSLTKVKDVLKSKGPAVHTVRTDDTLATLSKRLKDARVGVMIVSDDGKSIAGIISERDIAYGLSAYKSMLYGMPVSAVMTRKVFTCAPSDDLASIVKVMDDRHIRHLPVVENGRILGVIGMRDVMIHRLRDMERTARFLGSTVSED